MQQDHDIPAAANQYSMYQAKLLKAVVNHTGIRGLFSRSARVNCDNFNHCKLDFHSGHKFKPEEKVIIDLGIGSVLARELEAVIIQAERRGDLWYYQADFCFERKHMTSPGILRALLFVEHKLRIHASYPLN